MSDKILRILLTVAMAFILFGFFFPPLFLISIIAALSAVVYMIWTMD